MDITIKVRFNKRLFGNPDGNFSVYSATPVLQDLKKVAVNKYGSISISGDFYIEDQELGRAMTVVITEDLTARYPNSYKMGHIVYEFPDTPKEQWEYFKDGEFVSQLLFEAIKKEFGEKDLILDRIIAKPTTLEAVSGIGSARAKSLQGKLIAERGRALLFINYGKLDGVGSRIINSIYNWKADVKEAIKIISKNPFELLKIPGIGFIIADRFREHYKIPNDDPRRILHATKYYLEELLQSSGDTYSTSREIFTLLEEKLRITGSKIVGVLKENANKPEFTNTYGVKIVAGNLFTDRKSVV